MRKPIEYATIALGTISTIVTILATSGWLRWISGGVLLAIFGYVTASWMHYRRTIEQVPPPGSIFSGPYNVCRAEREDLDWISSTAAKVYTGIDVIPKEQMLEWFDANPSGFYVIKDADKRLCGNLDILPLRPASLKLFIEGKIIERDLDGSSLFGQAEHTQIRDLYVESFVAVTRKSGGNAWAAYECLMSVHSLVGQMCDPRQIRHIYAIAASKSGRHLVDHLGFSLVAAPDARRDQHDLYRVSFQDLIGNLMRTAKPSAKAKFLDLLSAVGGEATL